MAYQQLISNIKDAKNLIELRGALDDLELSIDADNSIDDYIDLCDLPQFNTNDANNAGNIDGAFSADDTHYMFYNDCLKSGGTGKIGWDLMAIKND